MDCAVHDEGEESEGFVTISCLAGDDGGLKQSFTLEVLPVSNLQARPNKSLYLSSSPSFKVTGLSADEDYTLTVTATNARGLSEPVTISYTVPALKASPLSTVVLSQEVAPILIVILVAVSLVIFASVVCLFFYCYCKKNTGKKGDAGNIAQPLSDMEYTRLNRCNNPHHNHGTRQC